MFYDTKAFNQPLNAWDVSNVKNMSYMFARAKAFNQDLCPWASRDFHLTSAVGVFYDSGCDNKNDPVHRNLPYQMYIRDPSVMDASTSPTMKGHQDQA